jgi:ketosteroid isomerase-like protein
VSLGFAEEDWVIQHWELVYGISFDEFGDLLHDDFEFVDHRPLHYPSGDAAALSTTMSSLSHDVEVLVPRVHRISSSGGVFERIERAVGEVLGEEHMLVVSHITDGTLRRLEAYAVDDLASALARHDAFKRPTVRELTNQAWDVVHAALLARRDGDREGVASLLAEDFVHTPHHTIMSSVDGGDVGKAVFVDTAFDPPLWGPSSTTEHELIAVRGDDLCLYRLRTTTNDGDLYERIILMEVKDGLVVRSDSYEHDQLAKAQIALDRRLLASLGFAEDHPWYAVIEWFYDLDPTVVARELPEHFR